jgi:membrane protease YdiL (CAAX protease family)
MTRCGKRFWLAVLLFVGILPYELNGWYNPRLPPGWFWCIEIFTWVVMPACIGSIAFRAKLLTPHEIGLHSRIRGKRSPELLLLAIVIATVALYQIDQWAASRADALFPENHYYFRYRDVIPPPGPASGWLRLLVVLYLSLSAGFVEEIYYRGMMANLFRGIVGSIAFILISSIVFTSVHWEGSGQQMFEAAMWGLAASVFYLLTSNLWPLIAAHVIVDFLWFK